MAMPVLATIICRATGELPDNFHPLVAVYGMKLCESVVLVWAPGPLAQRRIKPTGIAQFDLTVAAARHELADQSPLLPMN